MNNKRNKKGFTLVELIIVLAIMGILMAILIPAWNYFVRRAHEREVTSKAKVVFNAAQTEITRIGVRERPTLNIAKDPSIAGTTEQVAAQQALYVGDEKFYFYWDGTNGVKVDADGNAINEAGNVTENAKLARAINSITGGTGLYKIYVNGYNVESVVYTEMEGSLYKGTYPRTMTALEDAGVDVDPFRTGHIRGFDMTNFNISGT